MATPADNHDNVYHLSTLSRVELDRLRRYFEARNDEIRGELKYAISQLSLLTELQLSVKDALNTVRGAAAGEATALLEASLILEQIMSDPELTAQYEATPVDCAAVG